MNMKDLEDRVLRAIARSHGSIPEAQLRDMSDLARAGEPGVALENLSTQLYEYEVSVEPSLVEEIEVLGRRMGLDAKYWERFRNS